MYIHIFVMEMKIEEEIQQKSFQSEYQKVQINVLFTAAWLSKHSSNALKPFNISWQQFNIMRILKGMYPESATVKLLTERMIDKMSNASRLVEKLKSKGLVERHVCSHDRRRVSIQLTDTGIKTLEKASEVMATVMENHLQGLSIEETIQLNNLLDKMRD